MEKARHKIDIDFLRQLDRYDLYVKKRVSTVYAGNRPSTRSGHGIDTIGYREYYPGDEMKDIDWKAYGRTEKFYVRQFEEEKTLTVHILLDTSRSMAYKGKGPVSKYEYAAMFAVGVSYLAARSNDKYAISLFTDEPEIHGASRGTASLLRTVDTLSDCVLEGLTDLDACSYTYAKMIRSRSLVVIISDFMEDISHIEAAVRRFSENDLLLIQILDPFETELDMTGDARFHDMETEIEFKTYVSESFKKGYHEALNEHIENINAVCGRAGAGFYTFTTDTPIFDAFLTAVGRRL
ncbi:DUF58 domain-containing protein [Methanosarcinaceae archaeon]|nr:DUF58 domain-containing protein [Methanosarcinaceae archaeon]